MPIRRGQALRPSAALDLQRRAHNYSSMTNVARIRTHEIVRLFPIAGL